MSTEQFLRLWQQRSRVQRASNGLRRLSLTGKLAVSAFELFDSPNRPRFPEAALSYDPGTETVKPRFLLVGRPFEITDVTVH